MDTILGFIDEASCWLSMKDTDQWSQPWPDRAQRDLRVRRGLESRRTWMLDDDGKPVATISCRPDANRELWTQAEQVVPAVYVSRLIVARSHGGQHIGRELMDWAGFWAAFQYRAQLIRIDVWTTSAGLQNYYEKRGFWRVRFAENVEYPSAALFQKPTAGISAADIPRLREIPAAAVRGPPGGAAVNLLALTRSAEPFAGLGAGNPATAFSYLSRPTLFRGRTSRRSGNGRRA